jgi:prepilin-type N-terminal cleavage/methylation domain-containing protein
MKKRGFTLIELLAVIVVLAIIALIATPIVMNTIESSKKGATIESVRNMVHAAELYFISENPRYGKLNLLDDKLDYDGQKPELGEIEVNKDGNSRVYAYINGYCVTKEYDSELYASKTNKEECNWYATDNYETTEGSVFTLNNQKIKNYLIYGNSTQATRSGKNLYDYNNVPCFESTVKVEKDKGYSRSGNSNIRFYTYQTLENYIGQIVTISFDLTTSENGNFSIYQYQGNGIGIDFKSISKQMKANVKQRISVTGVVKELGTTENYSKGEIIVHKEGYTGSYLVNNIQFELGSTATEYEEYGTMPSPEFPSEIKNTGDLLTKDNCESYGSDACDNIGKYVVQVKATGKNLFDKSKYLKTEDYNKTINSYKVAEIKLKPNTTYKVSVKRYNGFTGKDNGYLLINSMEQVNGSNWSSIAHSSAPDYSEVNYIYTTSESGLLYIGYVISNQTNLDNIWKNTDVQIEEGTSATTYEPHREATTNIYLDEPLRKVDNTSDYIDFANNKVVRYIKNIDLSKCTIGLYTYKNLKGINIINALDETKSRVSGLSNREDKIGKYYDSTGHYMWIGVNNTAAYWVGILDYLGISTVTEFQQWIKANQVSIYYALTTPIEETIDLPNIELLDGTSTLLVNTSTKPSNVKLTTTK